MTDIVDRFEVVLVRHGETEWSRSGRHTGRTDVPLTPLGREAAEALGAVLGERRFALVLSSPLRRAAETCRLSGLDASVEYVGDLREWDYGEYEGRTTDEIRTDVPGWTVWTHPVPGGEHVADVGARADRVIERVRAIGGDTVLFGHAHSLRVLAARWCGLPARDGRLLALDTATISVLSHEHDNPVILRWNGLGPAVRGTRAAR